MRLTIILFFLGVQLNAQLPNMTPLPSGNWRGTLQINDTIELPVLFRYSKQKIVFRNGDENIVVDDISNNNDSVHIRMPVFDSEFHCKIIGDSLSGYFYNHSRKTENRIPFHAKRGLTYRFKSDPGSASRNITGRYHAIFDGEDPESKDAVGIFKQDQDRLTGTFLTTTGDDRFLEGQVIGNRLWLSTFDGSHLFLFTAIIKNDSLIKGEYFSGRHWHDTWSAVMDDSIKLTSPDSLTTLKPGFKKFDFTFPAENNKKVSLADDRFKNKAVIIQIMGTWCPNCLDETKFLSTWYNTERNKNIEIIALDYERITDTMTAYRNIRRLKNQLDINYDILFAGSSDKKEAAKTLPMLNRVFAFPTTIFLNKEKKVIAIHTGFNGPATGEEYEKYQVWFRKMVSKMD